MPEAISILGLKHTYQNGHNLTHAHNHITPVVTAMDSCFALTGAHQKPKKGTPFGRSLLVRHL